MTENASHSQFEFLFLFCRFASLFATQFLFVSPLYSVSSGGFFILSMANLVAAVVWLARMVAGSVENQEVRLFWGSVSELEMTFVMAAGGKARELWPGVWGSLRSRFCFCVWGCLAGLC